MSNYLALAVIRLVTANKFNNMNICEFYELLYKLLLCITVLQIYSN